MILVLGALVGFVASFTSTLLGGGSGLITIPAFYFIIKTNYDSPYSMHITITTVCGVSLILGLIATYKHYKSGHICIKSIKPYIPYIVLGAFIGSIIIRYLDSSNIKDIFAIVLFSGSLLLMFQNDNQPELSSVVLKIILASISGLLSVVVGVTSFVAMFFMRVGFDIKKAIAATSVCIFLKSLVAVIVLSINVKTHVPDTIGYINIPLLVSSAPFAAIGSLLAVKYLDIIPPKVLKMLLIVLMFVSSIVMML